MQVEVAIDVPGEFDLLSEEGEVSDATRSEP
jgi:hypothetical protein